MMLTEYLVTKFIGGAAQSRTGLTGFAIRGITALLPRHLFHTSNTRTINPINEKGKQYASLFSECGAGKESRTLDLNLGKVALYQLSYSRISTEQIIVLFTALVH
jgi:hypothetical protein